MKRKRQTGNILLAGSLLGVLLLGSVMSYGQDKGSRPCSRGCIYRSDQGVL